MIEKTAKQLQFRTEPLTLGGSVRLDALVNI